MKPWIWLTILVLMVFLVVQIVVQLPAHWPRQETLEVWLAQQAAWTYILFVLAFVGLALLPLPSTLWVLLGGSLFGTLVGSVLSIVAATVSAVLAFLIGRYFGQSWVQRRTTGFARRVVRGVEAEGWRFVAMTRLIPIFPFAPTNYALGTTRIPLTLYSLTTGIALIPNLVAYSWLGALAQEAMETNNRQVEWLLLGVALVALLWFLPGFIRRLLRNRDTPEYDEVDDAAEIQSAKSEAREEPSSGIRP